MEAGAMKAFSFLIALLLSVAARAQDLTLLVPLNPTPVRQATSQTTSSATLTPNGVYWTFNSPRATTTLGPNGELYRTFHGPTSSVTLLPQGQVILTFRGR
jgi:hypothetical protein